MKATRGLGRIAADALTVPERILLFCVASGTDWQRAGITGETVTLLVVKGLVDRDALARLTLTEKGRAALTALLQDGQERGARNDG
jgi:hypothetical protein